MRKRSLFRLWSAVFCLLLALPLPVRALTSLEPERKCSLTLHYIQEGRGFAGLDVSIYRVAQAHADGSFTLTAPFDSYPIRIHGITSQKEWKTATDTLNACIFADGIEPNRVSATEGEGTVVFTGLQTGLYLVSGVSYEDGSDRWDFQSFLVYLPTPTEDGFSYDVEAVPKRSYIAGEPLERQLLVRKLWQGKTKNRPQSIIVDILRDGVLQQTVTLSPENNWSYAWTAQAESGTWSVLERNVPEGYWMTVTEDGNVFTVTNTEKAPQEYPDVPQTGDTFPVWLWVLALCFSGVVLVILGVAGSRRQKYEKKK